MTTASHIIVPTDLLSETTPTKATEVFDFRDCDDSGARAHVLDDYAGDDACAASEEAI